MWSPDLSRLTMVAVAAEPDENASACLPPSSAATASSKASRVGLPEREYSYLASPGDFCLNVVESEMGGMTAPVTGSGCCHHYVCVSVLPGGGFDTWPAWTARVAKAGAGRVVTVSTC